MNERTMICLHIPMQSDHELVQKGLENLKPELLSFLRRLRHIDVEIRNSTNVLRYGFSVSRKDSVTNGATFVDLEHILKAPKSSTAVEKLLILKRTVTDMPAEPKRPGVKESELVMGFPVDNNGNPLVSNRDTFNFLPIRSYGLPVSLQRKAIAVYL